jgi:hypothetical protein
MRIFIPAASLTAGTVAASVTFSAIFYSGDAAATATHRASRIVGSIAGRGVNLVFGPVSGLIADQAAVEFGDHWLAPTIRTGSRHGAYLTAAAVGAAVIAVSTVLIHGSCWVYEKGRTALRRYLTQPPQEFVAHITDVEDDIQLLSVDVTDITEPLVV